MFTPTHHAIIDQQSCPGGLRIEIHEATLNSRTLWSVVAMLPDGNGRGIGQYDSINTAFAARDSYASSRK